MWNRLNLKSCPVTHKCVHCFVLFRFFLHLNFAVCQPKTNAKHARCSCWSEWMSRKGEHVSCHVQKTTLKTSPCDSNKEWNSTVETSCEIAENEFCFFCSVFVCICNYVRVFFRLEARDTICVKIYPLEITFWPITYASDAVKRHICIAVLGINKQRPKRRRQGNFLGKLSTIVVYLSHYYSSHLFPLNSNVIKVRWSDMVVLLVATEHFIDRGHVVWCA